MQRTFQTGGGKRISSGQTQPAAGGSSFRSAVAGIRAETSKSPGGNKPLHGRVFKSHRVQTTKPSVRVTNTLRVITRSKVRPSASPNGGRVVLMASRSRVRSPDLDNDPVVVTINRSPEDTHPLVSLLQKHPRTNKHRSRSRVTFYFPEDHHELDSTSLILYNDKFLVKIFRNLNWNELLPIRETCKKWLEVVSCSNGLKQSLPVVTIRHSIHEAMHIFNKSLIVWTQFRFLTSFIHDISNSAEQEFWSKHGPSITFLQIRNNKMSLTGFIDVLARCTSLEHLQIMWTPEMYSFNSELVKKYFGVHFRNGTFAKMRELIIEKSSYMVDNALWSLLKWCGGPLRYLSLTCIPDGSVRMHLNRLKPRWSIEPIQNYVSRFGYTGQLKFIDFSNSNLSSGDLISLGDTSALSNLTGIRLNSCHLSVNSLVHFLNTKGSILEEFYIDNVPSANEKVFLEVSLPLLRCLSISGPDCEYANLNFLTRLNRLDEFHCGNTVWCDYTILLSPFEHHIFRQRVKKLEIGGNVKMREESRRANFIGHSKWVSNFLTALPNLVHLDASGWGSFGNNENFRLVCTHLKQLEYLKVNDWKELGDSGVTGIPEEELEKELNYNNLEMKYDIGGKHVSPLRTFVGSLKYLHTLDISNSKVTNCSIKYGISHLKGLRNLFIGETFITDEGLQSLLKNCKTLDRISVDGCDHIQPMAHNKLQRSDGRFVFLGKP